MKTPPKGFKSLGGGNSVTLFITFVTSQATSVSQVGVVDAQEDNENNLKDNFWEDLRLAQSTFWRIISPVWDAYFLSTTP